MKRLSFLLFISMSFFLVWCWSSDGENAIPKDEMPEESSICPEGFYWFESIKRCMMIDNVE